MVISKICPVVVNNSGFINLYSSNALASMMYVAGLNRIPCREILIYDNHPISLARNMAVKEFMADSGNSHLLFIDSDVIVPIDIIPRMLKHDKLIVSGWYLERSMQGHPVVYQKVRDGWQKFTVEELKGESLITVDAVGAGCLMIKREVFDILGTPEPFMETSHVNNYMFTGEDLFFSELVMKEGLQIYVDPSLRCLHHHWINL